MKQDRIKYPARGASSFTGWIEVAIPESATFDVCMRRDGEWLDVWAESPKEERR